MANIRIKICGVTTPEDAAMAARQGADAVGVNFFEGSPRYVPPDRVPAILRALPPFVEPVAVLVSPSPARIQSVLNEFGFRTLQLHAANVADIRTILASAKTQLILATGVEDRESLEQCERMIDDLKNAGISPAGLLLDAKVPGLHGGTGKTAPWHLLADFRIDVPIILAGGLSPENVAEAIRIVRPYAVDVASGVEKSPGVKDEEKVHRFVAAVRES